MSEAENTQHESCSNQTQENSGDVANSDNDSEIGSENENGNELELENGNDTEVVDHDEQESSITNIDEPMEVAEENTSSDPESAEGANQTDEPEDQVILVAEAEPTLFDINVQSTTHVVAPEEVEVHDANTSFIEDENATLVYPLASVVVESATIIGQRIADNIDPERGPVSFAIGEPFVQEADAMRPFFLRRRSFFFICIMLFNATLILILVRFRNTKAVDEASTFPSPSTPAVADRETIKEYILKHTNSSGEILDDPTTNQFKALDFLSNEDIFYVDMNQELLYVQRYVEILVMLTVSGKPHLILPEYVASRTNDDFIDTMHISLTDIPTIPGSIPEEIGYLSELRTLLLANNGIGGSIPSGIGLLSNLVTLDLSNNQIEGSIPTELAGLKKIKTINFNDNKLTGEVPEGFKDIDMLDLNVDNNNLSVFGTF